MIDFHTHILPNVDDGSKGVEESTLMLTRLFEQGVNKVIATPHFYANDESVDEFLLRRNAAFEKRLRCIKNHFGCRSQIL